MSQWKETKRNEAGGKMVRNGENKNDGGRNIMISDNTDSRRLMKEEGDCMRLNLGTW